MAAHEVTSRGTGVKALGVGLALCATFAPWRAQATPQVSGTPNATKAVVKETATPPHPATSPAPSTGIGIGGHVGAAVPLLTVQGYTSSTYPANRLSRTQTVSDQQNLAIPIGVTFKPSKRLWIDFEFIVGTALHPAGETGFTVDPGVIYDWGPVATGLRLAVPVGVTPVAIGLIPLVHRGIAQIGAATWFVEADFPTFYHGSAAPVVATQTQGVNSRVEFNAVLHTGFGF